MPSGPLAVVTSATAAVRSSSSLTSTWRECLRISHGFSCGSLMAVASSRLASRRAPGRAGAARGSHGSRPLPGAARMKRASASPALRERSASDHCQRRFPRIGNLVCPHRVRPVRVHLTTMIALFRMPWSRLGVRGRVGRAPMTGGSDGCLDMDRDRHRRGCRRRAGRGGGEEPQNRHAPRPLRSGIRPCGREHATTGVRPRPNCSHVRSSVLSSTSSRCRKPTACVSPPNGVTCRSASLTSLPSPRMPPMPSSPASWKRGATRCGTSTRRPTWSRSTTRRPSRITGSRTPCSSAPRLSRQAPRNCARRCCGTGPCSTNCSAQKATTQQAPPPTSGARPALNGGRRGPAGSDAQVAEAASTGT